MFINFIKRVIFFSAVILLLACTTATSTKMSATWKAPDFSGNNYKNILVLGVAEDELNRRLFETQMSKFLQKRGVIAVPSHSILPRLEQLNEDSVTAAVKAHHYDGVIVTTLVGVDTEVRHIREENYIVPTGVYGPRYTGFYAPGYYRYYEVSYKTVHKPGYNVYEKSAILETNLYDVKSKKLIWSGRSTTIKPQSASEAIPSIVSSIAQQLVKEGVIRK